MILTHTEAAQPDSAKGLSFDQVIAALDSSQSSGTASGARVTPGTALQQVTVWACVRIIAEAIGQLPIAVQERQANGQWKDIDHDVLGLLEEPNDWQNRHDLMSFMTSWSELHGNAYLYKVGGARKILKLIPLSGEDVKPEQLPDWSLQYNVSGLLDRQTLGPSDLVHLRNFGTDGAVGLSTIANCREAIGLALKTEEHGSRLFKNGMKVGMSLEIPGNLDQTQFERLQKLLREQYSGTENAHKTMIVEGGGTLKPIGMTAEDAQFLETRRFQKQEIASLFGVPLFLLNDTEKATTWGSGLEQISKAFVRYTLNPRLSRLQLTLARQLLNAQERKRMRFVFDTDAFTMAEFRERMESYRVAIEGGILNPNECREMEGRNPREGGDDFRESVQVQAPDEEQDDEGVAPPDEQDDDDEAKPEGEKRQIFNITMPPINLNSPVTMPEISVHLDEQGDYTREIIEYDDKGYPRVTRDTDKHGIVRKEREVLEYDPDGNPVKISERRIK